MPEKVEIVKEVKLTAGQQIALMQAANSGGRFDSAPEHKIAVALRYLKLIELRKESETPEHRKKVTSLWRDALAAARSHDSRKLDAVVSSIRSLEYSLTRDRYWITKEGWQYLHHGKVTIVAAEPRPNKEA